MAKFTDLNDHCLEHILSYLELIDLVNVADTLKLFLPVVCTAYARKYGKKCLNVSIGRTLDCEPAFEIDEERIRVNNFSSRLKIIRCFGPVISKLELQYWATSRDQKVILEHYISEYCPASEIKIAGNVRRASMPSFRRCFANVTYLELHDCKTSRLSHNAAHLPHLRHLTILSTTNSRKNVSSNIIFTNPHLKSLKLHWNADWNHLQKCSEHLKELESLDYDFGPWIDYDNTKMIRFKNVTKLRFGFYCISKVPKISMLFDKLNDFTFVTPYPFFEDTDGLIDFIRTNPRITKFKYVSACNPVSRSNPMLAKQIAKLLPRLEESDLRGICFKVEEAIDFMEQCPRLKSYQFKLSGEYDVLLQRLSEDWHPTIDQDGFVKLERKKVQNLSQHFLIADKNKGRN